ncbi:MarR family winged helix-turn-helix transcriptional regulator [Pseudodesulfovibrio piezophilus]|uniref:Transcriptional regulator, MarR family n=1 Tax=Pseudodesulfovibrio piezophilus (strain DSM 21447 / JCM 15486 / C1TLV30) TaxID=1322246 RepID=M1WJX9_PSEP2|nr:MarR family transcriptional regulator [Pseudodesulfovibrio piezophilus]CCH48666.1 Transcriptional regulator, MarR family [Pseudodesulfovibrio piezophilus C1TLV30]
MRTIKDMTPEMNLLTKTFMRFTQISKRPMDFGVGINIFPAEIHTVERLCERGPMSITELAESSGVTKGAMSQLVSKLIKKGLAYRETDPDNLSKHQIIPTELGLKAHEGHMRFHMEHDKDFFDYIANLDPEKYAFFKELCHKMDAWMSTYSL